MATEMRHGYLVAGENGIHVPYAFSYATASARTSATGFASTDVGKLARQTDENSLWMLTDTSPTWVQVGGGSAGGMFIRADGTIALTANWDAGSYKITTSQLESDVVTGTAPLVVASTTAVANLNTDQVDGKDSTDLLLVDGSQTGATGAAQDFGSNGILLDAISESTSGAGVTIEGIVDINASGTKKLLDLTASTTKNRGLNIAPSMTGSTSGTAGVALSPKLQPSAAYGSAYGIINITKAQSSTFDLTTVYVSFNRLDVDASYTGQITSANTIMVQSPTIDGTAPTNLTGVRIGNHGRPGATNSYGLFLEAQSGSTNNYGIYAQGATVDHYIAGNVGIGATPAAKLHVDQSSSTGAVPVLYLDQADVSEELIEIVSTAGTGNAVEAVGAKTLTTTHFLKITLNGATRYIPVGTIA